MDRSNKDLELKKHVAVIHSSNKLTLLQRKIANALLFNAYKDLLTKDEHEIHVATLCQLIGYDSNDYKLIKKSLVNLLSTVLEWNLVDGERLDSDGVWNASSIIADASIDGPVCTYSYSNRMKQLLYRPNIYGRLDMLVQAKFQSTYGLALYENCNRFQDIGQSPWFDIQQFRKLMGVEQGKYKIFRDFKSRVLDKAVEEVNKYSSIAVQPQLKREKQKVVAIQFLIKQAKLTGLKNEGDHSLSLSDILKTQFGLSKKQIEEVLTLYSKEYIREKIGLVEESQSFRAGKIKNLAKYLISALKDDYQPAKSSQVQLKEVIKTNVLEFSDTNQKEKAELEIQYRRQVDKELLALYNKLPAGQKRSTKKEFEKYLNTMVRGIYFDIYLREGIDNPLIQDQLCLFLHRTREDLLAKVTSTLANYPVRDS